MRKLWLTLTNRGKAFLLCGLTLAIATWIGNQRNLLIIGIFLAALPLVAMLLVSRARLRLSCDRAVEPAQVVVGEPLSGRIVLGQSGHLPAAIVLLEDQVPRALGTRPRFVVDRIVGNWERDIRYPLSALVRGRFRTGPLLVRTTDPFGLVRLDRNFTATSEVLVTPRIETLPKIRALAGGGTTGEARPQHIAAVGQDDVLIREYRHGDDVRRVHWASAARRGELMVRREEQAWDPSVSILIDNRLTAHAGAGPNGSFEWAVSAAASIGNHLLDEGFRVEMYNVDGSLHLARTEAQHTGTTRQAITYQLTDIALSKSNSLDRGLRSISIDAAGDMVVAILGRITAAEATALAQTRRLRTQGLALLIDVAQFTGTGAAPAPDADLDQVSRFLVDAGWHVVRVPANCSVAGAWKQFDSAVVGAEASLRSA